MKKQKRRVARIRREGRQNNNVELAQIAEISKNARTTWFGLIFVLLFCGVALLDINDRDFFEYDALTQLPLLNVSVPVIGFFITAPLLALGLYIYLHIYLAKLWLELGTAPTKPNGRYIDRIVFPWLISDAALRLRSDIPKRPFSWITSLVSLTLGWLFGPIIIGWFWVRSWPYHDEILTLYLGMLLLIAIWVGWQSWNTRHNMVRGRVTHIKWYCLPVGITIGIAITIIGWEATEGGWISKLPISAQQIIEKKYVALFSQSQQRDQFKLNDTVFLYPANLAGAKIVEQPNGWIGRDRAFRQYLRANSANHTQEKETYPKIPDINIEFEEQRREQRAALNSNNLRMADLRQSDLSKAFLVGADLTHARLSNANLEEVRLEGANLNGAELDGANLSKARLDMADLSLARLQSANLQEARLEGANFNEAWLVGADLKMTSLEKTRNLRTAWLMGADLRGLQLQGVNLKNAKLIAANLSSIQLSNADLEGALLGSANLFKANLFKANLSKAQLMEANLFMANLREANLNNSNLINAYLWGANMENATLIESNLSNAVLFNAKLTSTNFRKAELQRADLDSVQLINADLFEANLEGTNLNGAKLMSSDFERSLMTRANMVGANLNDARLVRAKLYGVNLTGAPLNRTNFTRARLTNANFIGTSASLANFTLSEMDFSNISSADFSKAEGLSQDQINMTFGDQSTLLPPDLRAPKHWSTDHPETNSRDSLYCEWLLSKGQPSRFCNINNLIIP